MKLLNLLRTQLEKKSVGTLALGERSGFKEVFFERDHVFLCEPLISGKIDMATLVATGVLGDSLTPENLDVVLATRDLREEPLSTVLFNQNFIDETQRGALLTRQIREELLELFYLTGDSFHFQEGRVPEQLLSGQSVASRHPIDVEDLSSDLAGRLEDLRKYETILPSHEEIFVLTAEGMAYMQGNQDVGLHRVFTLIDGFRDLASLISCSRFYYHYVVQKIVESLENDFLKKRVLPEIRGIDPGLLSVDEAKSYLPHFKNAVKHSVDAMAARDRLASLYETLGMFDDAVVQYNFIGDALYRMKKPSKAIAAYQHALEIKPDNAMVTDKVIRIYQDAAEDEIEDGAADNAIQLLEKALYTRPEDTHVFQSLSAILVERGMLRDLTNLCDRVVAHARKTGNLRAGVGACRQILTLIPDSPLFQKKLVNIYLDSDQVEQGAREMAVLARIFMDRGQTERSLDMAEKVKRLRNKSPEIGQIHKNLEKELRVRGRHSRSAVVITLAMGLFAVFGFYQFLSYTAWLEIRQEAVAFADSTGDDEAPGTAGEGQDFRLEFDPRSPEAKNLLLSQQCESFVKQFPASFFRAAAEDMARRAKQASDSYKLRRRDRKTELLNQAKLHAVEGDVRSIRKTLQPLVELEDDDDLWKLQALEILEQAETFEISARDLHEKAQALEIAAEWQKANRAYHRLLREFPQSAFATGLTLPVLIETVPAGAELYAYTGASEKILLGETPAVVRLRPSELMRIELTAPDHYPLSTEVHHSRGVPSRLVLDRLPVWTLQSPRVASISATSDRNLLVVAGNTGDVRAIDSSTRRVVWKVERDEMNRLVGEALATDEGVYLVWNDRQVHLVAYQAATDSAEERRPKLLAAARLDALARTGAVALDDESLVLGTSGALKVFRRRSLKLVREISVGNGIPVGLWKLGGSRVVVRTATDRFVAYDVARGKTLWSKQLPGEPLLPPTMVGPSLVMVTGERDLLVLDPSNGLPLVVEPLSGEHQVCADPVNRHVFVLGGDGTLKSLSLDDGTVGKEKHLGVKASRLFALNGRVGVLHSQGQKLLVLDSETLTPRWALRMDSRAQRIVATQNYVIAVTGAKNGKGKEVSRFLAYSANDYPDVTREVTRTWLEEKPGSAGANGEETPTEDSR